jgi:ferrous iron transport protein A
MNLTQIEPGETVIVEEIPKENAVMQRLRDLGLTEGMAITCVGRSPLGDPSAYLILGSVFALRREDCRGIQVRGCR